MFFLLYFIFDLINVFENKVIQRVLKIKVSKNYDIKYFINDYYRDKVNEILFNIIII